MEEIVFEFESRLGRFAIGECKNAICRVFWPNEKFSPKNYGETPLLRHAAACIERYVNGGEMIRDFPFIMNGTEFQRSVWQALLKIPYGETRSYGEIARILGKPFAARAVGMACSRNPLLIIVPCHRVIGGDGSLCGFVGGLEQKRRLIQLERQGKT